jgi:hypothetical protein
MPRPLLRAGARGLCLAVAFGTAALLTGAEAGAAGGTAQVSIEIPAGKTKTVRLRDLPRGTRLTVRIDAGGKLAVALISRAQLKSPAPEALFRGALDRRMTFQVVIPESGHYYLVLDNRRGGAAMKARATIRAEHDAIRPSPPSGGA